MPCYHPIEAWDYTDQLDLLGSRQISMKGPQDFGDREKMIRQGRRLLLPCRKCVGCRLDKSREWANRVVMEQLYHQESWFLTLTYDDEHLPPAYPVDPATGEILSVHSTLVKDDLQKFFKRLRFNSKQELRYFASGEYGSQTYRPHYHCLIFGLHLDDLQPIKHSFCGDQYYISDFISKCWPFGIHILGQVTWNSAAYVARYTMKKATHGYTKEYYEKAGIQSEFQMMSLRPAIGRRFYDDHPDLFEYSTFNVTTMYGGLKMSPPEYFRKLHKKDCPLDALLTGFNSALYHEEKIRLKLSLTDRSYYDILNDEERKKLSSITSLIRDTI